MGPVPVPDLEKLDRDPDPEENEVGWERKKQEENKRRMEMGME